MTTAIEWCYFRKTYFDWPSLIQLLFEMHAKNTFFSQFLKPKTVFGFDLHDDDLTILIYMILSHLTLIAAIKNRTALSEGSNLGKIGEGETLSKV